MRCAGKHMIWRSRPNEATVRDFGFRAILQKQVAQKQVARTSGKWGEAMTASAADLQKAIFATLESDPALVGLLGSAKIYDRAPANQQFPYLTFGRTSIYDWSTGTESGSEHLFTLHIWSKAKGKMETLEIMEVAKARLADGSLVLDNHHLVNIRLEFAEARYDEDLAVHHGLLRYRAVIEDLE